VFVGVGMLVGTLSAGECGMPSCPAPHFATSTYVIGGASLGAGLALGAAGFVVWRRNYHAAVRVEPLGAPPVKEARVCTYA
jgi:hypothetical protein